jgi:hypothetical protein
VIARLRLGRNWPLLVVAGLWLAVIVVVDPRGEFPLNDDWAHAWSVMTLLQEGRLQLSDWRAVNLLSAYMQCYANKGAVYQALLSFRKAYPTEPITLVSDCGQDFSGFAKLFGLYYYRYFYAICGGSMFNRRVYVECYERQNGSAFDEALLGGVGTTTFGRPGTLR